MENPGVPGREVNGDKNCEQVEQQFYINEEYKLTFMEREELRKFLDEYLDARNFANDNSYNGLQVEGSEEIRKLVGGTSISVELIERAIEKDADAILVHHGLFWKDVPPILRRSMKRRVELLIKHDINLFAYHIPLDYHDEVGNNVQLLKLLGLPVTGDFGTWRGMPVGKYAELEEPTELEKIVEKVKERIRKDPLIFPFGKKEVKRIAVVSGGGCSTLPEAVDKGFDLFITGEPMEWCESYAKDEGINVIFAGHYHTERFGVMALGELLKRRFGIEFEFVEIEERI